jgi:8-oxo-dGTP diphosphatase
MKYTTVCYIEKDGSYLMLHRVKKENDANKDKWIGIGGKFLNGESPEDCLLREVLEETGLSLNSWRYRGIVTFVSDRWETEYMHVFTSDDFSGRLIDCDEGVLEWVKKDRLSSLPLWEGDKIFHRLIDENAPFFSLKLIYEDESLVFAALNGVQMNLRKDGKYEVNKNR